MPQSEPYDDARVGKQKQGQSAVFEFTRRKRWADTLVSEAPDLAIFILSKTGTIWYTGPAVVHLLGWKVGELIDKNMAHILNDDDLADFREDLGNCATSDKNLDSYARLKCKPPADADAHSYVQKELLYELVGNFVSDVHTNQKMFFILTAKPYPSKNMAIINTVLELKIEHEVLSQRLAELRLIKAQRGPGPSTTPPSSHTRTPHHAQLPKTPRSPSEFRYYNLSYPVVATGSEYAQGFEEEEDVLPKKKRPFSPDHQFVCYTCGRTDSPEWRKGPTGPKTLCNACGLRWAKRIKKTDKGKTSFPEDASLKSSSSRKSLSTINPPAPHPALRCTPPSSAPVTRAASGSVVHTPSPSTASFAAFIDNPLLPQPQIPVSPQGFLLPPSGPLPTQPGSTSYSSLQHALAPESEPAPPSQEHFPPWSTSTSTQNSYGY